MERAWKRQRNEKKRDINRGISGPWPRPTQSAPVLHLYLCQCFYHYKTLRPSLLLAHVAKKAGALSPIFSPAKVGCSRTRLTVSCTVRNSLWVSSASWWRQSCETFFIVCTQQCDLDQIIHQSFIRRLLYASANPSGRVVRMHIPTLVHFNLWNYKSNRYNIWNFIDIKRKLLWGGEKKNITTSTRQTSYEQFSLWKASHNILCSYLGDWSKKANLAWEENICRLPISSFPSKPATESLIIVIVSEVEMGIGRVVHKNFGAQLRTVFGNY